MKNEKTIKQARTKKLIPIFFATDDNYAPYLAVSLRSMLDNASKNYFYNIYVLNTKLTNQNYERLSAFSCEYAQVEFVNVTAKLDKIGSMLHLRDYYSKATYYRFFIASLFPQYKKALYLDCDIVVLGDISELYRRELGSCYAGAVQEEVMATVKIFGDYVEQALGIPCKKYFNAGIMLLNLDKFRADNIESRFIELLNQYKFTVTQDQDYLNVLCKNKMVYFDLGWNKTPIPRDDFDDSRLKLVHYKIAWKPWHYDDILYGDYFWDYAKKTVYYPDLLEIKKNYSDADKQNDVDCYEKLKELAIADTINPFNYHRLTNKNNDGEVVMMRYGNDAIPQSLASVEEN